MKVPFAKTGKIQRRADSRGSRALLGLVESEAPMGHLGVRTNLPTSQAPPAQMVGGGEPAVWQRLIPMTQFRLPVAIWVTWTAGSHP